MEAVREFLIGAAISFWDLFHSVFAALLLMRVQDRVILALMVLLVLAVCSLLMQWLAPTVWAYWINRVTIPAKAPRRSSGYSLHTDTEIHLRTFMRNRYTWARLQGIGWLPFRLALWLVLFVIIARAGLPILQWLNVHIATSSFLAAVLLLTLCVIAISYYFDTMRRRQKGLEAVSPLRFSRVFALPALMVATIAAVPPEVLGVIWKSGAWALQSVGR